MTRMEVNERVRVELLRRFSEADLQLVALEKVLWEWSDMPARSKELFPVAEHSIASCHQLGNGDELQLSVPAGRCRSSAC